MQMACLCLQSHIYEMYSILSPNCMAVKDCSRIEPEFLDVIVILIHSLSFNYNRKLSYLNLSVISLCFKLLLSLLLTVQATILGQRMGTAVA